MTITYHGSNLQSGMSGQNPMNKLMSGDPNKLMDGLDEKAAWTIAQSNAMAKVKAFMTMAKTINDQQ
jgi:hypothetical protein